MDSIVANLQSNGKEKLGTTQLLFTCAQSMGLQPKWVVLNSLFAVTTNNREQYVYFACSPLNSHVAISIARNKNLTRLVLARHQLQNIPFLRPDTVEAAITFLETHKKIIAKPHSGSGSRDVHIITQIGHLKELPLSMYILEKYIAGIELRYLVLNGTVIGVHRSEYGQSVDEDRHLERISYPPEEWDPELSKTSLYVAGVLGLNFGAVDFLITEQGRPYILEVNSSPGLKWFHAPSSGPIVNVAQQFLQAFISGTTARSSISTSQPATILSEVQ